ncbi:12777_t:CDS:2 [Funneliformis geosporum]|uniref:5643_t:CDS:1 n=1 Tax=Funneliformis geosporum TaxID=1117311 RepID=A0A9W4WMR4_9GLOM|nr:12777_t:CDS:2 [Funneliformis geosporum]CAI2165500.1 5643_t:CDS:2 [Funneliformis geosporum]
MTSLHKRNQERTHEENQERAYIAASHRGDRSMEARIESARKASEIHKKRTGKALRITPEDVRNEEMYQEIDPEEETKLEQFQRDVIGEPPRSQGRSTRFNEK